MPSITHDFLSLLREDYTNYSIFVETGTYKAETILAMEPFFEELHTIEIHEQFWYDAKQNYHGNKINFHWDDTEQFFPVLLPQLKHNTIFFLDAHWSGVDTGLGKQTVPLYEELNAINKYFTENAIIIIDDFRLFETQDWEYINKKKVLECVIDRVEELYHLPSELDKRDRLILHIKGTCGSPQN